MYKCNYQIQSWFMPGFIVQHCQISNNIGIATTDIQVASMLCNIYIYWTTLSFEKKTLFFDHMGCQLPAWTKKQTKRTLKCIFQDKEKRPKPKQDNNLAGQKQPCFFAEKRFCCSKILVGIRWKYYNYNSLQESGQSQQR